MLNEPDPPFPESPTLETNAPAANGHAAPGDPPPPPGTPPAAEPFDLQPVHRAAELEWNPQAVVVLFGSHEEADAAQALLPETVCVGWCGDRHAADTYEWGSLRLRSVFIWPGASHHSADSAAKVASILKDAIVIRTPPEWNPVPSFPFGINIAVAGQAGYTAREAQTWLAREQQRLEDQYERARLSLTDHAADREARLHADALEHPFDPPEPTSATEGWPFRILGYDDELFFYLPAESQQLVRLQAPQHTKACLLALAPQSFWEAEFGGDPAKPKIDWHQVANRLIRLCRQRGLFASSIIRGRGCWVDREPTPPTPPSPLTPPGAAGAAGPGDTARPVPIERVVFHAGDQIICNRQAYKLEQFPSRFVYERGQPMDPERAEPLSNAEAKKFLTLCESLSWQSPIYGKFLAGWCMAAAVCGCLKWRPHIWITGPAGSGKSWTVENIVNRFLDRFTLSVLSSSTEAGMRQSIRSDAMPIVIDEFESEDDKARNRTKAVLDLVRQSSSESGAAIVKGSTSGEAIEFRVRSCFCFSSIGVAAVARADTSRITVLSLCQRADNLVRFEAIKELARETILRADYAAGLRARAISLALQIRQNAIIFAEAIALKIGDHRSGDQLGALIAGAFALTSNRVVAASEATDLVNKQGWSEFTPAEADKDETRALAALLEFIIRIDRSSGPINTSIGELIGRYYGTANGAEARLDAAEHLLLRGVKVTPGYIDISASHREIGRIYSDTIWAGKWKDQLRRIPTSEDVKSAQFGVGLFTRATRLFPAALGLEPLPGDAPRATANANKVAQMKQAEADF